MEQYQKFVEMAVKLGANDAKIIKTDSIVTAAWTRWKYRYGCPEYNKSLCCPPNSPTHHETRELVDCYEYALLEHHTFCSKHLHFIFYSINTYEDLIPSQQTY